MKNSAISWWFLDAASFYGVFKVKTKQAMDEIVHCDVMGAHMVVILHLPIFFFPLLLSTSSSNQSRDGSESRFDSGSTGARPGLYRGSTGAQPGLIQV